MKQPLTLLSICLLFVLFSCQKGNKKNHTDINNKNLVDTIFTTDTYSTDKGDLMITLVGHASLIFQYNGKIIHIDPYSSVANYHKLPKADLIILTHEHSDHLDTTAINQIKKEDTYFLMSKSCNEYIKNGNSIDNGDSIIYDNILIKAVPAYNMINKKPSGEYWHPKGRGNGYIFTFGDKRIYVAGDTENIPEMDKLKNTIDIAFLPKNLPYTMSDEMFVDAVKKIQPKYLYPYHFSEYNKDETNKLLADKSKNTEVIIRPMTNIK